MKTVDSRCRRVRLWYYFSRILFKCSLAQGHFWRYSSFPVENWKYFITCCRGFVPYELVHIRDSKCAAHLKKLLVVRINNTQHVYVFVYGPKSKNLLTYWVQNGKITPKSRSRAHSSRTHRMQYKCMNSEHRAHTMLAVFHLHEAFHYVCSPRHSFIEMRQDTKKEYSLERNRAHNTCIRLYIKTTFWRWLRKFIII